MKQLITDYTFGCYHGSEPSMVWGFDAEITKFQDICVMIHAEKFGETNEP